MKKILESFPFFIVLSAALVRLLPHEPNFAPIGALALFGGACFKGWKAFVVPILAMFISDVFLGFHTTIVWVYGSFLIISLLGKVFLSGEAKWGKILGLSLISSVLFYLITNFGVWVDGSMYPRTLVGLAEAMLMGLPFLRNTVLGDLTFNTVFFGAYALAAWKIRPFSFAK